MHATAQHALIVSFTRDTSGRGEGFESKIAIVAFARTGADGRNARPDREFSPESKAHASVASSQRDRRAALASSESANSVCRCDFVLPVRLAGECAAATCPSRRQLPAYPPRTQWGDYCTQVCSPLNWRRLRPLHSHNSPHCARSSALNQRRGALGLRHLALRTDLLGWKTCAF